MRPTIPLQFATLLLPLVGCGGGLGGEDDACAGWRDSDPGHAPEILADLQGGTVAASPEALTLSWSGHFEGYNNAEDVDSPVPTAALYSRRVPDGDFELTFAVEAMSSTSIDLAAFVTIQNESSGKRFLFVQTETGEIADVDRTWDPYGRYRFEDEDPSGGVSADALPLRFTIRRDGWTILHSQSYGEQTEPSGEGSYDRVSGVALIGFGLQNRALDGASVDGDISVTFSGGMLTTEDGACDSQGFSEP